MLRTALAYGADAVCTRASRYSLRVRHNDFGDLQVLAQGVAEAHAARRKLYVVSNILPHNAKLRTYLADMKPVIASRPDALIMADPGLIDLVRESWPEMPIHLSVQASTLNFAAVRLWQKLGLARIILSRKLSLQEIGKTANRPRSELLGKP
jgi:putative protease